MDHTQLAAVLTQWYDEELDCRPFFHCDIVQKEETLQITTAYPFQGMEDVLLASLNRALLKEKVEAAPDVRFLYRPRTHAVQHNIKPLKEIHNIIVVASGKGGVGKSTVTLNLATSLHLLGANVGLLDADIYGPSQGRMLGGEVHPHSADGKTIDPVMRHGMQTLSIADLIDNEKQAMIWRGPILNQTLQQMLFYTNWRKLDYLIVDLPPGTGDIQLTIAQKVPVSGAVIVTTPQDISLIDARKAKTMFDRVSIHCLGVVENMSYYRCSSCGHKEFIFGADGGKDFAKEYKMPLLGSLPLTLRQRQCCDKGLPIVLSDADEDEEMRLLWRNMALRTGIELAARGKSYGHIFPKVVVEK